MHNKAISITNRKKEFSSLIKSLIWMLNNKKYLIKLLKMLLILLFKAIMEPYLHMVKLGLVKLSP